MTRPVRHGDPLSGRPVPCIFRRLGQVEPPMADDDDVRTGSGRRLEAGSSGASPPGNSVGYVSYVAAMLAAVAAHLVMPATLRPAWFVAISVSVMPPLAQLVRRCPAGARGPWRALFVAYVLFSAGYAGRAIVAVDHRMVPEILITLGYASLLVSALSLVILRGRRDPGGVIDAAVVAMGVGSLLWTSVLQPRAQAMGVPLGSQAGLLVTMFMLTGILGSLGRLWATGNRSMLTLRLMIYALISILLGNISRAVTTGSMSADQLPWVEALYLMSYACLGGAVANPAAVELSLPGPARVDRLSTTRLVFLGISMAIGPAVGGGRQLLGLPVDGLLIAISTLAVVPLVLVRVGVLSTQRARAERALAHQATHDALTGLPNRAEVVHRLTVALDREGAAPEHGGVVLLFCDLNGFKGVNDRFGHDAGDQLLVQVAARLSAGLRSGDTVARYGGDEFLVLCEGTSQREAQVRLCAHLRAALEAPFDLVGERVVVGASVGAVVSDRIATAEELIRRADHAMYQAKAHREADGLTRAAA
jgi:diguanylate cyclase (GGDEF)-like protein